MEEELEGERTRNGDERGEGNKEEVEERGKERREGQGSRGGLRGLVKFC